MTSSFVCCTLHSICVWYFFNIRFAGLSQQWCPVLMASYQVVLNFNFSHYWWCKFGRLIKLLSSRLLHCKVPLSHFVIDLYFMGRYSETVNILFLINLSTYLLILVYTCDFLFYYVDYNSLLSLFIFMLKLFQIWPGGAPWNSAYIILTFLQHSLSTFPIFGTESCSRFNLYFSCPSPGDGCYSMEPWFK